MSLARDEPKDCLILSLLTAIKGCLSEFDLFDEHFQVNRLLFKPKDCPIGQQPMGWMRVLRQGAWSWLSVYVTRSKEIEMEPGDGTGNLSFPVRTPLTQDSWGTSKRIVTNLVCRGRCQEGQGGCQGRRWECTTEQKNCFLV